MFKHFATSVESQQLFVYAFWFIHCKFFQVRRVKNKYITNATKSIAQFGAKFP